MRGVLGGHKSWSDLLLIHSTISLILSVVSRCIIALSWLSLSLSGSMSIRYFLSLVSKVRMSSRTSSKSLPIRASPDFVFSNKTKPTSSISSLVLIPYFLSSEASTFSSSEDILCSYPHREQVLNIPVGLMSIPVLLTKWMLVSPPHFLHDSFGIL